MVVEDILQKIMRLFDATYENVKEMRGELYGIRKRLILWGLDKLKEKLVSAPTITISPDLSEPHEVMYDASRVAPVMVLGQRRDKILHPIYDAIKALDESKNKYMFDFGVKDRKMNENQVADYSSILEDEAIQELGEKAKIHDAFLDEHVFTYSKDLIPWFTDIANNLSSDVVQLYLTFHKRKKFMHDVKKFFGIKYIHMAVDYVSLWVEANVLHNNEGKSVITFLKKNIFSKYGTPKSIIRDDGSHFCNNLFKALLEKYGVLHNIATAYHPRTSGQVEVSNQEIKKFFAKSVNTNRTDLSRRLDDALCPYNTAYKTPICMVPYQLLYGKTCHLPVNLEHKVMWAMKRLNLDRTEASEQTVNELNVFNEFRLKAYEKFSHL
ncbi:uncharacterized protein LOC107006544 [Solanum pennellii]|uniref:Uncharacterized protein LOC107006544 n=1 Tax=Solanum pennellii TaxID=28526 RepID=A0ABM1FR63_SOLPN|nr:uncharacterized protein LOC107006544 [Solanum pennellii]